MEEKEEVASPLSVRPEPSVGQASRLSYVEGLNGKENRDYTRQVYQNLMAVVEALEEKAPLPLTQKELSRVTGLSKNVVFDICWNLCKKGWAEDMGDGSLRLKRSTNDKDSWVGRMVRRAVRDAYGVEIKGEETGE